MNVRWTERASKDALGIFDYIANQSEAYADSVYARMLVRPNQLELFPDSGSIVPEYNRFDIREVFVHSFRLIYRIDDNELRVLTVIHGSRQLPPKSLTTANQTMNRSRGVDVFSNGELIAATRLSQSFTGSP